MVGLVMVGIYKVDAKVILPIFGNLRVYIDIDAYIKIAIMIYA